MSLSKKRKEKYRKNPMSEHRGKNCLVCDIMLKIAKNHLTQKLTDLDLAHKNCGFRCFGLNFPDEHSVLHYLCYSVHVDTPINVQCIQFITTNENQMFYQNNSDKFVPSGYFESSPMIYCCINCAWASPHSLNLSNL